jgi:toxin ParE1/3/4
LGSNYSLSNKAIYDIEEILDYISADNPKAAVKLFDRFEELFEILAIMPKIGTARPELGENIRSMPEKNYTIYFQTTSLGLEIARIIHNARDIKTNMFQ